MRSAECGECGISGRGRSPSDAHIETPHSAFRIPHWGEGEVLSIDLRGKRALVAGVADDAGYGFAIARALAEAGATVCAGSWPPPRDVVLCLLDRGQLPQPLRLPACPLLQLDTIAPPGVRDTCSAD